MRRFEVPDGWVAKGFTFALEPTVDQLAAMGRHFGARRFAYNWALRLVKSQMDDYRRCLEQGRAEGLSQREAEAFARSGQVAWNLAGLRKRWNVDKHTAAIDRVSGEPWWPEVSKEAFSSGIADAVTALDNWRSSKTGVRKGRRVGFPRFKKRGRDRARMRFTTGAIRLAGDRRHVVLPRLGALRTAENTRRLERRVSKGAARILSATLFERAGRFYVSFACVVSQPVPARRRGVVGLDLGVGDVVAVAATADGTEVARLVNLRPGRRLGPRLAAAQRQLKRRSPGSIRYRHAAGRVARLHAQAANIRTNHAHVFTHRLAETQGTVVVEDLNVTAMAARAGMRLGRSVGDAAMLELKRQIAYKLVWAGGHLVVADRWYPSSQLCSTPGCDYRNHRLTLAERTWSCPCCRVVHDRDVNAAVNLSGLAELQPGVEPTVRPGLAGLVAMKREGPGNRANLARGAEMAGSHA